MQPEPRDPAELRILLLEDNPDHAEIFQANLEETQYARAAVSLTGTLGEGVRRIRAGEADIAFVDLGLLDSSIEETVARLPELAPLLPVVVTTSIDHGPTLLELISTGVEDCVPKIELQPLLLERVIRFALDRFEQRSLTAALLRAAPQPMVYRGGDGRLIGGNSAFADLVGRTPADLAGAHVGCACPEGLSEALMDPEHAKRPVADVRFVGHDGKLREGQLHHSPFVRGGGRAGGVVTSFVDLTEQRRMERALRQQDDLRYESLASLTGGIAHEFNNSLMAIMTAADELADILPRTPDNVELVGAISAASGQAADRVRQMLAYCGLAIRDLEPTDLNALVIEVADEVRPNLAAEVQLDIATAGPAVTEGDRSQLGLLFRSVLVNAVEAVGEGPGRIEIRTAEIDLAEEPAAQVGLGPGTYARVEVCDTGCGMNDDVRRRAFDPFFTTKFIGRGLGLAAGLGVARAHGGTVELDSRPGKGTCCRALLPLRR